MKRNFNEPARQERLARINFHIRVPFVRVVREEEQLGVMATDRARRLAEESGLDLVEVAPMAKPPVCRIMDYGKYRFEQMQKEREKARKQRVSAEQLKELRLRPGIDDHDVMLKTNQARGFIEDGKKVQFTLIFRGKREQAHKDRGFEVIQRIIVDLNEVATVESAPRLDGNRLICRFAPRLGEKT